MAGTRVPGGSVFDSMQGYNLGAVTANLVLWKYVAPAYGRVKGVRVYADTAGTGGGNTVVDILRNPAGAPGAGTSIWSVAANKPTLAATSTGEFANSDPDLGSIHPGDQLFLVVSSISSTGHASLYAVAMICDE